MDTYPIRYYLDNHISKVVVIQLRRRGVDVIHYDDVGLANASDLEHLEYATSAGRVVVSQDRDFSTLNKLWQQEGRLHSGIMLLPAFLQGIAQTRFTIKALIEYDELINVGAATLADDVINQLQWL